MSVSYTALPQAASSVESIFVYAFIFGKINKPSTPSVFFQICVVDPFVPFSNSDSICL